MYIFVRIRILFYGSYYNVIDHSTREILIIHVSTEMKTSGQDYYFVAAIKDIYIYVSSRM